jgi:hypothetical protein
MAAPVPAWTYHFTANTLNIPLRGMRGKERRYGKCHWTRACISIRAPRAGQPASRRPGTAASSAPTATPHARQCSPRPNASVPARARRQEQVSVSMMVPLKVSRSTMAAQRGLVLLTALDISSCGSRGASTASTGNEGSGPPPRHIQRAETLLRLARGPRDRIGLDPMNVPIYAYGRK